MRNKETYLGNESGGEGLIEGGGDALVGAKDASQEGIRHRLHLKG